MAMECILRVIKGSDAGLTHRLTSGATVIGRSANAALRLTSLDVSWEHALITRRGDDCILENLSASGTYVGDAKVTGQVRLRGRDQIRFSRDTILRFETVGGPGGLMANRALLITMLVLLTVAVGTIIWTSGVGQSKVPDNWDHAFHVIDEWLDKECKADRMDPMISDWFQEAWRLESARDYSASAKAWRNLRIKLQDNASSRKWIEQSLDHSTALQNLLVPRAQVAGEPDEQDIGAALVQFAQRREAFAAKQIKSTGFRP